MKVLAIIDLIENRIAIEDRLVECWQKRGTDENFVEIMDTVEADLIGENALSADKFRRSFEFFPQGACFTLARGFRSSGDMFGLLEELHMQFSNKVQVGGGFYFDRFYDVSVDKRLSKKRHAGPSDMRYMEHFPGCGYFIRHEMLDFSIGQKGLHLKGWSSIDDGENFGAKVEDFVKTSKFWEGYELTKWPAKTGGVATLAKTSAQPVPAFGIVKSVFEEAENLLFEHFRGFADFLYFAGVPQQVDSWEKCRNIVIRRYEESSLFSDMIGFPGSAIRIHELRARKEDVFGTAYEKIGIVLMSSSWKGTKFLAKRVFEDGRYLLRMKLAGKEAACRALLKEMEEELGVEIKIESCK